MKPIANTVDDLFQPRELAEDEYLNEADGLIYCSKCHTPRQHHIELKERVFLPTVRCRCQQEEYDKEEAERKHQEFLMQVSRLKANGLHHSFAVPAWMYPIKPPLFNSFKAHKIRPPENTPESRTPSPAQTQE